MHSQLLSPTRVRASRCNRIRTKSCGDVIEREVKIVEHVLHVWTVRTGTIWMMMLMISGGGECWCYSVIKSVPDDDDWQLPENRTKVQCWDGHKFINTVWAQRFGGTFRTNRWCVWSTRWRSVFALVCRWFCLSDGLYYRRIVCAWPGRSSIGWCIR